MPLGQRVGGASGDYVIPATADYPAFRLVTPTQDQVTAFENFLTSSLPTRISARASFAEFAARGNEYRVEFTNVGLQSYAAQFQGAPGSMVFDVSEQAYFTRSVTGPDGTVRINVDALAPGGTWDFDALARALSHELGGHGKYGPHLYNFRETWPYPRAPTPRHGQALPHALRCAPPPTRSRPA